MTDPYDRESQALAALNALERQVIKWRTENIVPTERVMQELADLRTKHRVAQAERTRGEE